MARRGVLAAKVWAPGGSSNNLAEVTYTVPANIAYTVVQVQLTDQRQVVDQEAAKSWFEVVRAGNTARCCRCGHNGYNFQFSFWEGVLNTGDTVRANADFPIAEGSINACIMGYEVAA